jgi:hypothetical protein
MPGLKINFVRSELFCFGNYVEHVNAYKEILTFKCGILPLRDLCLPTDKSSLLNKHCKRVDNEMEKYQGLIMESGGILGQEPYCLNLLCPPLFSLFFHFTE